MLTEEERSRIEDEERKRIAEEQYRVEVRLKLRGEPERTGKRRANALPWIIAICMALTAAGLVWSRMPGGDDKDKAKNDEAPVVHTAATHATVPKTRYVPVSQKIASGQIVIRRNGTVQYRLTIPPDAVDATVTGSFNASGGLRNDIKAVIADEMNFTNWVNGHPAQAIWGTEGWQTVGNIEARLAPGTYYLAFSNRGTFLFDKQVFVDIGLTYKKAETYYE